MSGSAQPLGSRYLLEEELGHGAMGVVWRARDRETGAEYAVKIIRPELVGDPKIVARFVQERTLLLQLRHRSLVAVHDMIVEGDRLALVMDLVRGRDMTARRQARGGTLPPAEAAELIAQICDALATVHAAGVVHRDVKPANVLLDDSTPDTPVRLVDFGIARLLETTRVTSTGMFVGTVSYLAPEVALGEEAGPPADVYATGLTLYEMLVGRPPFASGHLAAVINNHLNARLLRPAAIPEQLWRIIDHSVAKKPVDRPSAALLAEELRRAAPSLAGLPAAPVLDENAEVYFPISTSPEPTGTGRTVDMDGTAQILPTVGDARPPVGSAPPPAYLVPPLAGPAPDERPGRRRTTVVAAAVAACAAVAGIAFGVNALLSPDSAGQASASAGGPIPTAGGSGSPAASPVGTGAAGGGTTRVGTGPKASPKKSVRKTGKTKPPASRPSSSPAASWTGGCSPVKTFPDGAKLTSCFKTDHRSFVISGKVTGIPAGQNNDQLVLVFKDSGQTDITRFQHQCASGASSCSASVTVPAKYVTSGNSYTVLPQRFINGNWVQDKSDGHEPGMLAF